MLKAFKKRLSGDHKTKDKPNSLTRKASKFRSKSTSVSHISPPQNYVKNLSPTLFKEHTELVQPSFQEKRSFQDNSSKQVKPKNSSNERYYIYDHDIYKASSNSQMIRDPNFNIFDKPNGINPTSTRYVIHYLTIFFKNSLNGNSGQDPVLFKAAIEIFKPNLSHFSSAEIQITKTIISSFFPWDGCSLNGDILQKEIKEKFDGKWNRLVTALRILWSNFPQGLIPWDSYIKFCLLESRQNVSSTSFYKFFPQVLPNYDYTCCALNFLEILVAIISNTNLLVNEITQLDLIYTAGQVCICKTQDLMNHIEREGGYEPDLISLAKVYHSRGFALHHLFVSYLRSLVGEGKIKDFYLIDAFKINEYPPSPYNPTTQRALTLTVPRFLPTDAKYNNFNQLIKYASKAKTRLYSSNHTFTKVETALLDKFEEDTYKLIDQLFSKSSKRYLTKFDPNFDIKDFQSFISLQQSMGIKPAIGNQYDVASWINSSKSQGFNEFLSVLNDTTFTEGTLALDHPILHRDLSEVDENMPLVRISKMNISEWFLSSWKYETFFNKIQNTLMIKLTKRIGDCGWLVITTDERVIPNYCLPVNSESPTKSPSKPSVPEIASNSLHNRDTFPSYKSRPLPPNLLGAKSSSPFMESASVISEISKTKGQSMSDIDSSVLDGVVNKHNERNKNSVTDLPNHNDPMIKPLPKPLHSEFKDTPLRPPGSKRSSFGMNGKTTPVYNTLLTDKAFAPMKVQNPSLISLKSGPQPAILNAQEKKMEIQTSGIVMDEILPSNRYTEPINFSRKDPKNSSFLPQTESLSNVQVVDNIKEQNLKRGSGFFIQQPSREKSNEVSEEDLVFKQDESKFTDISDHSNNSQYTLNHKHLEPIEPSLKSNKNLKSFDFEDTNIEGNMQQLSLTVSRNTYDSWNITEHTINKNSDDLRYLPNSSNDILNDLIDNYNAESVPFFKTDENGRTLFEEIETHYGLEKSNLETDAV